MVCWLTPVWDWPGLLVRDWARARVWLKLWSGRLMAWPKGWVLVVLEGVSVLEAVANAELEEVPSAWLEVDVQEEVVSGWLEVDVQELVPSLGLETDVLELVPSAELETVVLELVPSGRLKVGVLEEVAELAAQSLNTSFAELSTDPLANDLPSESGSSLDAEL